MPGLGPVPDDGEAPGRAPEQQHLPLRVGQFLGLVHHDVRERSGEQIRLGGGQFGLVDQADLGVLAAQHPHQALAVVTVGAGVGCGLDQVVDDLIHALALGGEDGLVPTLSSCLLRVAEPLPRRVQERQIGHRPVLGSLLALQRPDLVAAEPGSAHPQVGGYRPQVSDEVGRFEQRPCAVEGGDQLFVVPQRPAEEIGRDLTVVLVHEDGDQFLPDLLTRLVVRRTWFRCLECLGPVVGAQPDVGPVGRDGHPFGGRLFVEPDGRFDRLHHVRGRLQAGHVRVGLDRRSGSLGDEVPQGAGLHALLAEAGQDVGDVGQVGLVRTDEQHAAPAVREARVGVEEIGGAVQRDDGLPRTRTAVDDESAAGSRADDGVLVGLDGAEHIAHPRRAVAAQAGDEGGLVVERGMADEPVRGEHLVPVVADPAAGPAISATARQTHRVGVGGSEERLGRGGTPVEQQPTARAVGEAKSSDVQGLGMVRADHVSEAQVQTETTQCTQASAQPVDLRVPVHRLPACAAGRLALGIEAVGHLGDRLLQALREGREVLLVARDQRRVGLGRETVGKVECAGGQRVHVISSEASI